MTIPILIVLTAFLSYRGFSSPVFVEKYLFDSRYVSRNGEWYRLFTSGFLHVNWGHLILNMVGLYFFGSDIEVGAGSLTLLAIYFGSIVGGSLLSLLLYRGQVYRSLGASGGVYGVLLAYIFLFPGGSLIVFPIPIALPTWLYVILFMVGSIRGLGRRGDNIGHAAHLGGAATGLLIATVLYPSIVSNSPLLYFTVLGLSIGAMFYFTPRDSRPRMPAIIMKAKEPGSGGPVLDDEEEENAVREILLDKISRSGMESLTAEERALLERLSRKGNSKELR